MSPFEAMFLGALEGDPAQAAVTERRARYARWSSRASLLAAALFAFLLIAGTVDGAQKARRSPIFFLTSWVPDQPSYRPGELIRFRSDRVITEPETLLLYFELFRNVETGEAYPEPIFGQGSGRAGRVTTRPVRHLPERMTPGKYMLEGWTLPQGPRRALPARYVSDPFQVEGREP